MEVYIQHWLESLTTWPSECLASGKQGQEIGGRQEEGGWGKCFLASPLPAPLKDADFVLWHCTQLPSRRWERVSPFVPQCNDALPTTLQSVPSLNLLHDPPGVHHLFPSRTLAAALD